LKSFSLLLLLPLDLLQGWQIIIKVYMELGSYFLFLQEQIKDIIIIMMTRRRSSLHSTPLV